MVKRIEGVEQQLTEARVWKRIASLVDEWFVVLMRVLEKQ